MTWTHFYDMNSGGGRKEDQAHIFIEAPEDEAVSVFYRRFRHNPHRVTCTCCGPDYSISEHEDLAQATGYERNCEYVDGRYVEERREKFAHGPHMPLEVYVNKPDVLVIYAKEIEEGERHVDVPEQGYVWHD